MGNGKRWAGPTRNLDHARKRPPVHRGAVRSRMTLAVLRVRHQLCLGDRPQFTRGRRATMMAITTSRADPELRPRILAPRLASPTPNTPHNPGHCIFSTGGTCFPVISAHISLCLAVIPHLTQLSRRVRSTPLLFCDVCATRR